MRILHFADLHIGVENYGRVDPATGLSTRLGDFLGALDELVDFALANEIDLVLFCGDAYKSRDPSQTHQREFARRIVRLTAAGVPVFLLVGNHDLPYGVGRATAVDIFPTLGAPLVQVGARVATHLLETRRGERLQVVALPWATRSHLLTYDEYKNLSPDALNEVLERKLEGLLLEELDRLDPGMPAVLAGHVTVSAARTGSEQNMMVGRDPVVMKGMLADSRLDYVALGHIHKAQALEGAVPMVYAGSLQRVDFGEEDEEKGFYVVDMDPSQPRGQRLRSFEFVPVHARAFVTISVRSRSGNPTEDVLRAIGRQSEALRGAIVRVQVNLLAGQEGLLDDTAVRRALGETHYIAGIAREVKGSPRSRWGDVKVEELTPLRALEKYLESRNTSPERMRELLEYGRRIIEGADEPPPGLGAGSHLPG